MENNLCKICGKIIPEKRLQQGKNTCCHRCAVKLSYQNPEVSARKSAAQKKRFQDPEKHAKFCSSLRKPETRQKLKEAGLRRYQRLEEHEKQSVRMKELHANPEYKTKHLASMRSEETLNKISVAQKKRFQDPEKHRAFIEAMNKPETKLRLAESQRQAYDNPELRQKISKVLKNVYAEHGIEINKKKFTTMKINGSFSISKEEEAVYAALQEVFSVVERQKQYPHLSYHCDFYIPSLDLYIEYNGMWTHGSKPFDETDKECIKQLNAWKEKAKTSKFYQAAIDIWTISDVKRKQCAIDNNLNWLCFYSMNDFKQWLNTVIKH